jgi:outer membrane protein OmpA-like peptidoglycan-associated protein
MIRRSSSALIVGLLVSFCLSLANAQETALRAQIFDAADRAMASANEARANILAPTNYEQAAEHYRAADADFTRGRNLDRIRDDLAEAILYFNRAITAAALAQISITDAIAARDDAETAEAARFADEQWRAAELEFADAARRLEAGNLGRSRRAADAALQLYRDAELVAIEENYLSGARRLIAEADRGRVDRSAPVTLQRAKNLLAEAEQRLRNDRYDTDLPRSLAREANYEARHSMYLAERIEAMDDREISAEQLLLDAEVSLTRIAGELDIVAELDQGFGTTEAAVVVAIGDLQARSEELTQTNEQVAFLEDELSRLEVRLGDESEQRQLQEQVQQRFAQLAAVFTRDEAVVLRRGNDVIVRMGLNFDSGSAVVKSDYFALLRKIQTAIDVFPDSHVEIQGHTDSFGADDFNLDLSTQRATAVQRYLLANMDSLGATEIVAVGYGETVPVANNETPEGRTRNRRIDLMIEPNLDMLRESLAAN